MNERLANHGSRMTETFSLYKKAKFKKIPFLETIRTRKNEEKAQIQRPHYPSNCLLLIEYMSYLHSVNPSVSNLINGLLRNVSPCLLLLESVLGASS